MSKQQSHLALHVKNLIRANIHDDIVMENVFRYVLYNNLKYKMIQGLLKLFLHDYSDTNLLHILKLLQDDIDFEIDFNFE